MKNVVGDQLRGVGGQGGGIGSKPVRLTRGVDRLKLNTHLTCFLNRLWNFRQHPMWVNLTRLTWSLLKLGQPI